MINCVGCALRPFLRLSSIISCPPVTIKCVHTINGARAPKILVSFKHIAITIFVVLFLGVDFFINQGDALDRCSYDSQQYLMHLLEKLFSGTLILFCISGIFSRNVRVIELNGIGKIVESCNDYGISCFLTKQIIWRSKLFLYVIVLLSSLSVVVGLSTTLEEQMNESFAFILYKYVNRIFYTALGGLLPFQLYLVNFLYHHLFKKCIEQTRAKLVRKISDETSPSCIKFENQLKCLQRLYLAIEATHRQFVLANNIIFVPWLLFIVISLVVDNYSLVLLFTSQIHFTSFFQSSSYGNLVGLIVYFYVTQGLQDVSEDILSFLYKYPISKLNAAEAAQVEMLITTLKIQKPVLRASDIFTVGTRLLASISGTVVTYVLVALQFHASWVKK